MASRCSVGTARDVVNEPTFRDLSNPSEIGRLRSWVAEITQKANAHQAAVVCLNREITRLEARIDALTTSSGTNATDIATLQTAVTELQADVTALDGHAHDILIGTASGGDAVEFSGGVDGTLDTPAGAGGNALTEVFTIP